MKHVLLSTATLLLAAAVSLPVQIGAQTIAGTWQGTLPIAATGQGSVPGSGNPRVVFIIEKNPDASFHGEMAMIDRGSPQPLTSITFSASNVTFALGDTLAYHGKLSADGKSIAGTMTQGNQSLPLTLQLATSDTLWKREAPAILPPMAASADPSFDVATIKPATPDEAHALYDLRARKFSATGTPAGELIKIAYNIRGRQVIGGPPWLNDRRYDIVAEPDTPGLPSENQTRAMVHKLLAERFHLVCHTGEQPFPVLALTLDPKGPPATPTPSDFSGNGGMSMRRDGDDIVIQFSGTTIHEFLAWLMNNYQDKQLVDETGLSGLYNITLRVPAPNPPNPSIGPPPPPDNPGITLITATEQAGFKFVSKKAPLTVVIVDHIDPPTPN